MLVFGVVRVSEGFFLSVSCWFLREGDVGDREGRSGDRALAPILL